MYRTDKQFMTNPATAGSRIYIGGLQKTIVATDLEEKFQVHGKILGLVLQMGFAFIQFETDSQAQSAITNEMNTMLHGKKITVKQALDKTQNQKPNFNNRRSGPPGSNQQFMNNAPSNQPFQNKPPNQQFQNKPPNQPFQNKPPNQQFQNKPPNQQFQNNKPPSQLFPNAKPPNQQFSANKPTNQQFRGNEPLMSPMNKECPPGENLPTPEKDNQEKSISEPKTPLTGPGPNKTVSSSNEPQPLMNEDQDMGDVQGPGGRQNKRRRGPHNNNFRNRHRQESFGDNKFEDFSSPRNFSQGPTNVGDQPDRNDCEIIVVSKALTKYAEYIEQRLKSLGLLVDLLFPNEDVPIGRVLANISSRGCLYAILIMPQNEEHRSLTMNILHGLPQEHRNMPIEDALILMTRNFDSYMRGDKSATETLGSGGVMNISDRHPTAMQLLLNLLAENRQITSSQYDKIVKYLQDRREVQHQHEITEGVDQESQESNTKQTELQNRIMSILNNKATDNPPPPVVETPPKETAPPLLKDPSVQKALDSILGGDMFKNINTGA